MCEAILNLINLLETIDNTMRYSVISLVLEQQALQAVAAYQRKLLALDRLNL